MGTSCSKFWMGLGLGSIIGALVYRFSCSPKGKLMKEKVCHAFHKAGHHAEEMMYEAKEKAWEGSKKVADKMADGALDMAVKADDAKDKVHTFADNAKKDMK